MTNDRTADALHRLATRPDIARPLSPDAQARVEARLDAAFVDASRDADLTTNDGTDDIVLVPVGSTSPRPLGRWRWLAPMTAAAAVLLVVGLVVVSSDDPQPVADLTDSTTGVFPADLLRSGALWRLATDPIESEGGAARASLTVRMDDASSAQARVQTADVPPRQFLGQVRFDLDPTGHVLVPLLLLDPERAWVDCDATIDLLGSGTATCAGDVVDYAAASGPVEVIATPAGRYEAQLVEVDWTDGNSLLELRTRLWISAIAGLVRIDIDDGEITRAFTLEELEVPRTTPVTTPSGD